MLDCGLFEGLGMVVCLFFLLAVNPVSLKYTMILHPLVEVNLQWIKKNLIQVFLMLTNLSLHVSPLYDCKEIDLITRAQSALTTKYCFEAGDRKIAQKVGDMPCLLRRWMRFMLS